MKRIRVFFTVVVLSVLVSGVLLAQSNPFAGTWNLNTAESRFSPGPAPESQTLTLEAQGNGVKASCEGTAAHGSRTAWSYKANYDGNDNPISETWRSSGDTIALKRIDPNTTESTIKRGGEVVRTSRLVVSKDGKVMTITAKGTNWDGQPVSDVLVFDKQ